ncbi:MAG: hypothetical protein EP317_01830 [Bacillota bacterium]|nr:MAG: hypothetical protein EP317_01830 [Bacillota bacterium]
MLKWVGRFIYLIFVLLASFFVMLTGASNGYTAFIKENMVGEESNLPEYLKGLSTLEYLDYIQSDPFYYVDEGDHPDVTFKMGIYAIGKTFGDEKVDGFLIYIYEFSVKDEENNVIDDPSLQINVTLDRETYKPGNSENLYDEITVTYNPDQTASLSYLALYDAKDYLKVPDEEDVFAHITKIEVLYSVGDKNSNGTYEYLEIPLFVAANNITSESPGLIKVLDFEIDPVDYQLRSNFSEPTPSESELTTFGLSTEQFNLNRYNWYIWRALIIYVLVIIVITYFLFFHKKVMEKRRFKKIDTTSQTRTVTAESIFKEPDQNEKDGK